MKASFGTATSAFALLFSVNAYAQSQPATPGASARTESGIEDIVVTARRREESAQTVPVSVTAFWGEALDQRNVRAIEDLSRITPGLRFSAVKPFFKQDILAERS